MKKYRSSLGVTFTGGLTEEVTSWAGATLLVELYRKAGVKATVLRIWRDYVRTGSWKAMLGYSPPAAETAKQWLDKFHNEQLMKERPVQGSFIPAESARLAGLKEPNRQVVWTYVD